MNAARRGGQARRGGARWAPRGECRSRGPRHLGRSTAASSLGARPRRGARRTAALQRASSPDPAGRLRSPPTQDDPAGRQHVGAAPLPAARTHARAQGRGRVTQQEGGDPHSAWLGLRRGGGRRLEEAQAGWALAGERDPGGQGVPEAARWTRLQGGGRTRGSRPCSRQATECGRPRPGAGGRGVSVGAREDRQQRPRHAQEGGSGT